MAKIRNVFTDGKMNRDIAKEFMPQTSYRLAENLRFHINDGDDGKGKSPKGSLKISDVTEGSVDLKCIGAYHNQDLNVIYYKLASTDGLISIDAEYNINTDSTAIVLKDTNGVLKYNKAGFITGWDEIDGLQIWSEWGNNPRRINTERVKADYLANGANNFTEEDIQLIVIPPHAPPILTPYVADPLQDLENNMLEKLISYAYRWKYLDGEYSVLSPFSNPAYLPLVFEYDYSVQSNKSMVNSYYKVDIDFKTGNERVVEVQLVFTESESNTVWVIDDFNKEKLGWSLNTNETKTFTFDNSKTYKALPESVLQGTLDAVPRTNKSQALINGRLLLGNYKENYNIKDDLGVEIEIDFSLNLVSWGNFLAPSGGDNEIPRLIPEQTLKSNRDYEVGVIYLDDPCRSTTILVSKTNTIFVPNSLSRHVNSIDVILNHKPPAFAKYFRFFIKQSRKAYDQIVPTFFYEDGIYRWVKIEGGDKDKIVEGEYLIVKSDTQGFINQLVKTKIIEVGRKEKNFLQPIDVSDTIKEIAGIYMKINPVGFHLDRADYNTFNLNVYSDSFDTFDLIYSAETDVAHFYGSTLDDLTSSGTYTGTNRKRYTIRIDDTTGLEDTFEWTNGSGLITGVAITVGVPQHLSDGIYITFANDTGHSLTDEWKFNARAGFNETASEYAYGYFKVTAQVGELMDDASEEVINIGTVVRLHFSEYREAHTEWEITPASNARYDNIQEWFWEENIIDLIQAIAPEQALDKFYFLRGKLSPYGDDEVKAYPASIESGGVMMMMVRSRGRQSSILDKRAKIRSITEVLHTDGNNAIVFETDPKDAPKEVFYEIPKTYDIVNGLHMSGNPTPIEDQNQTVSTPLKAKLDWFNAFCYGNAIESYKIKDEFNRVGITTGIKASTVSAEGYKETDRVADITWSSVYSDEANVNGLSTFNLSTANWVTLDKERASIQKLLNFNGDVLVFQENAIGIMPYNKSIIKDVSGGDAVGITKDILNKESYRPYGGGLHGISKNPESVVPVGRRVYGTDKNRGDILRLANDGLTEINQNDFEHDMSDLMEDNANDFFVCAYDPKHKEYLIHIPTKGVLGFKEKAKGFPNYYTFSPDFMLGADNALYAWKDGVMYKLNETLIHNEYFGEQKICKIKFYVNHEFGLEKVFKAMSLKSTHAWDADLKTQEMSRTIPKEHFEKISNFWYSDIMTNTNTNTPANNIFGIGDKAIVNGEIAITEKPSVISIGDTILSATLLFTPSVIVDITEDKIIIADPLNTAVSFLMYSKNQGIDGVDLAGDYMEVELTLETDEEVTISAVNTEVVKDN